MDKKALLQSVDFGDRVAENEAQKLKEYFVKTDQWRQAIGGQIDVFYGPKGSGKSAIYSLLYEHVDQLFERQILFIAAENPRGSTAFRDIIVEPPTSEQQFIFLWKLYFLCLAADTCRDYGIKNEAIDSVTKKLVESKLLPERKSTLSQLFSNAFAYVRRYLQPGSLSVETAVDPASGRFTGFKFIVTPGDPNHDTVEAGAEQLDKLLLNLSTGLADTGFDLWLGIDRLDVAFAEAQELEANALRALFKTYLDFQAVKHLRLKIFLRSDIWKRITEKGFREASHITKALTISWTTPTLLNLVMRRLLQSAELCSEYRIVKENVLSDLSLQQNLFHRVFPNQVDVGEKKPATFDWMLSRTADGTGATAPRELIHLLSEMTREQLRRLDIGEDLPPADQIYSRSVIKESLAPVSTTRLEQTLYAEHPSLKPRVEALREQKATQSATTLARIWQTELQDAARIADELVDVGFFERRGAGEAVEFWVPFLYRDALDLVQGRAE